jgi:sporulation and spore germination protein/immunoglobulin-like protein involved in spore germination
MNHEDALRRVLNAEAETVDVAPDALEVIRARIDRRRARFGAAWLPRGLALFAFTGGTAAVAAALVAVVLIGVPRLGHQASPGTSSGVAGAPPSANLPVYYVATTSAGPRLYREYHPLLVADQSPAAKAEAAVEAMLTPDSAFDPDYTSPWPAGVEVHAVRVDGDTTTVDLAGLPTGYPPAGIGREQLVWTVTASTGVPKVRLLVDGQGTGVDLTRGRAADVLAPVWLIDPQQGAPVGHAVKVHLAGSVFEGVVRLRVRTLAGVVISDQQVQLSSAAPDRGEASLTINLSTGTYLVEAYVRSARDGSEQFLDGHRISVP